MTLNHVRILFFLVPALLAMACSSGLGNNTPNDGPEPSPSTANLALGLDLGVATTAPIDAPAIAGIVLPGIGGAAARELALVAFTTASAADDADGSGTRLARDGTTTDSNAADDVFVSAIVAADVDESAFSQRLAGKFRHPRCMTCHAMQVAGTLSFASSPQPHAGPPPGPSFPNNTPSECQDCHVGSTLFPVVGWQAPAASFDIRSKSVAEIATMAQNVPTGDLEHFVNDARVLWALDSGVLPIVGGRNGIADDDHDGVLEPEDTDGRIRTVPGGSIEFLADIEEWNAGGNKITNADAVADVELVSQASGGGAAGNGGSRAPALHYVASPGFDPTSAGTAAATNPAGLLYVVFASDASDLTGADSNGVTDVFRAVIEVRVEEDPTGTPTPGGINLRWLDSTSAASAASGSSATANAASRAAAIGGQNGEFVTFESAASDLVAGFVDNNGAAATDVFRREVIGMLGLTTLVSRNTSSAVGGASGGAASDPAISADGLVIGFASDATDLVANDTNALRDVFFAQDDGASNWSVSRASVATGGGQGSGGASDNPTVSANASRVLVAFESSKTDLAVGIGAATNVYLFDSTGGGTTTMLSQLASPTVAATPDPFPGSIPAIVGIAGNGDSRNAILATDGSAVTFETDADNLDVLRPLDENRASDIVLVELQPLDDGLVLPFRVSLTGTGTDGDGDSTDARFGSFAGSSPDFTTGLIVYSTAAKNLGTSDTSSLMVAFLDEKSGVLVDFSADVTSGAAPLTVQFTDSSSGNPTTWAWDLDGDGNVDSTEQNPSFLYPSPGTFSVALTASNRTTTGTKTSTDFIRALGPVVASFSPSATVGVRPFAVTFTDTSTEVPTSWAWDFDGDGITDSTDQNPTVMFTDLGSFDVTLTAMGPGGADTVTQANLIRVFDPIAAEFSATPLAGLAPLTVNFTDLTTGSPTAWEWDFDGDMVIDSTVQHPTFQFVSPGNYTVSLRASSPASDDTETKPNFIAAGGAIVASFTVSATGGVAPLDVTFTDTSSGTPNMWQWDFEDDMTIDSTLQDPMHTFSTPGTFTVRLIASGPGASDDETVTITVVTPQLIDVFPSKDNTLYEDADNPADVSNGAGQYLFAGAARTPAQADIPTDLKLRRAVLEFNIAGSIPAGATIQSAALRMRMSAIPIDAETPPPQNFSLRLLSREWGEGSSVAAGEQGAGGTAATGDASWSHAFSPNFTTMTGGTAWTSLGGDFGASRATTSIGTALGNYTWNSNSNLVADVQSWLDSSAGNHGWLVRGPEGLRSARRFDAREGIASQRPRLRITYIPPF